MPTLPDADKLDQLELDHELKEGEDSHLQTEETIEEKKKKRMTRIGEIVEEEIESTAKNPFLKERRPENFVEEEDEEGVVSKVKRVVGGGISSFVHSVYRFCFIFVFYLFIYFYFYFYFYFIIFLFYYFFFLFLFLFFFLFFFFFYFFLTLLSFSPLSPPPILLSPPFSPPPQHRVGRKREIQEGESLFLCFLAGVAGICQNNSHIFVYSMMVVNQIGNYDIISLFYPLSAFAYAAVEYRKPPTAYWRFFFCCFFLLFFFVVVFFVVVFVVVLSSFCFCSAVEYRKPPTAYLKLIHFFFVILHNSKNENRIVMLYCSATIIVKFFASIIGFLSFPFPFPSFPLSFPFPFSHSLFPYSLSLNRKFSFRFIK